jgi:hypothetical protein
MVMIEMKKKTGGWGKPATKKLISSGFPASIL